MAVNGSSNNTQLTHLSHSLSQHRALGSADPVWVARLLACFAPEVAVTSKTNTNQLAHSLVGVSASDVYLGPPRPSVCLSRPRTNERTAPLDTPSPSGSGGRLVGCWHRRWLYQEQQLTYSLAHSLCLTAGGLAPSPPPSTNALLACLPSQLD